MKFADGIRLTVEWYRKNAAWWKKRKAAEFWEYYRANYKGLPETATPSS
jgi:dTDP-D-glucose 4,6-dehydratase